MAVAFPFISSSDADENNKPDEVFAILGRDYVYWLRIDAADGSILQQYQGHSKY